MACKSEANLFSLANKKEKVAACERLTKHMAVLSEQVRLWVANGSELEAPVAKKPCLQRAGFQLAWLKKFLEETEGTKESSASSHFKQHLVALKQARAEGAKMLESMPDPMQCEATFLAYMGKNGKKLATEREGILKQVKAMEDDAKRFMMDEQEYVKEKTSAEEVSTDLLNSVSVFTLLTLIRNPTIRNPQEGTLRKNLQAVLNSVKAGTAEAGEILGLGGGGSEAASEAAAPSAGASAQGTPVVARKRSRGGGGGGQVGCGFSEGGCCRIWRRCSRQAPAQARRHLSALDSSGAASIEARRGFGLNVNDDCVVG